MARALVGGGIRPMAPRKSMAGCHLFGNQSVLSGMQARGARTVRGAVSHQMEACPAARSAMAMAPSTPARLPNAGGTTKESMSAATWGTRR